MRKVRRKQRLRWVSSTRRDNNEKGEKDEKSEET